ncbi:MAG: nucleotidyltransferase domain-containing protein [Elusimicrobia bacterium]|nr:nucleotidyltransferase domain-containing protein [Elusimicrobiota bacterium]
MLKQAFNILEKALLREIKDFYGQRLVSVAVFGSSARGTQNFESDMDILIVADGLPSGRIKRVKEFATVEKKIERFLKKAKTKGVSIDISPVIKSREEVEAGSPLFLDMVEDAKIIFDRNGFFRRRLLRLKEKLNSMGAKRIWKEGFWYWVLKPDYKFGDVIEL